MNPQTLLQRLRASPDTVMLCGTILIAPQLFGGTFPWAIAVIAALALMSLGTALWIRRSATTPVIDSVTIAMGAAWAWTCVQALPLPAAVARGLKLGSAQSAERLQGLAWAGNVPFTISYDPGSTHLQILIGIAILSAFLAARLRGPTELKPIAGAVVLSAVLIGLEGLAHKVTGAAALFGSYSPRFTEPQLLTPLMNNNHLGGFALLGALVAAGLAAQQPGRQRHLWGVASAFCALIVAWTLSRGAIGGLLFGFVLLAAWLVRNKGSERRGVAVPTAVIGATVAGVIAFAGLEPILRRFERQGFDKLEVAAQGFHLLEGSTWWLGVGRGAFSSAFVAHEGSIARFTHPENLLVQWTTEWGVPVAVGLITVLVLAWWKRLRGADGPMVAGACIAIVALALQNLVDFGLEMAGIVVVVAALLGALLPQPTESAAAGSRWVSLAPIVMLVAAFGLLAPRVGHSDTQSIVDRLTRAMRVDDEAGFQATLHRGLSLHPGEPAIALLAGTYAGQKRHPDAARWLSIVMEEAPGWGAPHAIAARWLLSAGRTDQALLQIREAEQRHPSSAQDVLCELLARFPETEHLERAAPDETLRIAYLDRTASCASLPPELRTAIDAAILREEPTRTTAVLRQARRLSAQERADEAIGLLETALVDNPEDAALWVAVVRAHLHAGDTDKARAAFESARDKGLDSRSLVESQARVEAALGQTDEMRATLTRLRGLSRGQARLVAASFIVEGELEASLGNIEQALAAYRAADVANPDTPALQYAAKLALSAGRPTFARRAYAELCDRKPGGAACAQEARLSKGVGTKPPERPMP